MNILHMKYAYEVSKAGSLSKAAEALVIAAPKMLLEELFKAAVGFVYHEALVFCDALHLHAVPAHGNLGVSE